MIIVFLTAILISFTGQLYFLNYSIQGMNRAIISTPIELLFNTVSYEDGGVKFSKTMFEEVTISYYDNILYRYCKQYDIDFYYYNINDGSMCLSDSCEAVEITVESKLMNTYDFHRVMFYELVRK